MQFPSPSLFCNMSGLAFYTTLHFISRGTETFVIEVHIFQFFSTCKFRLDSLDGLFWIKLLLKTVLLNKDYVNYLKRTYFGGKSILGIYFHNFEASFDIFHRT